MHKKIGFLLAVLLIGSVMTGCVASGGASTAPPAGREGQTGPHSAEQQQPPANEPNPNTPPVKPDPVTAQLNRLSLEEKIGQLVLVGMDGTTLGTQAKEMIEQYHVGGFIFFKPNLQNAAQAVSLFNSLKVTNRSVNPIPLFLCVDEEGGRVSRLPNSLVKLPASRTVGKKDNPVFTRELGQLLGSELKAFGLNVDFAPVMDVASNPKNPVIGDRSFGSDPKRVSRLGVAEMEGLQDEHVIPGIKHFPGHGDTSVDSHLGLPIVQYDRKRLRRFELVPFADAVRVGADMVMVAHILLPKLDPDHPSSFSEPIITGLLRKELGFGGVVITDDMTMGAIAKHYDVGAAAVQAVLAGSNIVLVGHEFDKQATVLHALRQAAMNGSLPMKTIDERVYQILALKQKYKLADEHVPPVDVKQLNQQISDVLNRYK
ncbi:beta-N-acetylhexosaminidase [Brevibacillus fluminis]|uniref:beta-N-acetylhexosaminidase n=1 Tax=Brevibacillus fluminis TaxID=511487 RepID=UPI003F8B8746